MNTVGSVNLKYIQYSLFKPGRAFIPLRVLNIELNIMRTYEAKEVLALTRVSSGLKPPMLCAEVKKKNKYMSILAQ